MNVYTHTVLLVQMEGNQMKPSLPDPLALGTEAR